MQLIGSGNVTMPKREPANIGNPGRLLTNSFEQSAGIKRAPDSARGALANLSNGKRFYCATCQALRVVTAIDNDIVQTPSAAIYSATLDCSHSRQIVINVRRPTPKPVGVPIEETEVA
jgi:hypothetical protein